METRSSKQRTKKLTAREQEILRWVSEGKSDWETAKIVGCKMTTAKKLLQHIYQKLGVENEFLEEDWLYEAITEVYLPLARMAAANWLRDRHLRFQRSERHLEDGVVDRKRTGQPRAQLSQASERLIQKP